MANVLDSLTYNDIIKAIDEINLKEVPIDNKAVLYWIEYMGKKYQYAYTVHTALRLKGITMKHGLVSSANYRKYIEDLGFKIREE